MIRLSLANKKFRSAFLGSALSASTTAVKTMLIGLMLGLALSGSNAFAFSDMNGKKDSVNNHIGKDKWTIVEIWESNCVACRTHMPEMVEFDGKLKNARLLGISLDGLRGIEEAEDFIAEYDVKFPTILTNFVEMNIWMERSIGESLRGTPTFILFDPKGRLVAAQPGIVSVASLEKFITENSTEATAQTEPQNN